MDDQNDRLNHGPLTFAQLCLLEPRLGAVAADIRRERPEARRDEHYCANRRWVTVFKPRLSRLVGWTAPTDTPAELRTSAAYDVAYDHLFSLLPNCRRCACLSAVDLMGVTGPEW